MEPIHENLITPDKIKEEEETPAELSEVDLGNKDQVNFDELISFSHTYLNYRIARTYNTLKELDENIFGLLMSNEFLLAGSTITIDSLNSMSNSELVKTLNNKTKNYNTYDNYQKITFVENIPFHIKQIGLEETVDLILPIILNIHKEGEEVLERFLNVFNSPVIVQP